MLSSTSAATVTVRTGRRPFEDLDLQRVARRRHRGYRPASATSRALRRAAAGLGRAIDDRLRRGVGGKPVMPSVRDAVAGAQAHRRAPRRLDVQDARQVARPRNTAVEERGSTNFTVASCRMRWTNCWLISSSITSMNARPTNSTATAKAMPDDRRRRPDRLPLHVPEDHARRQRQTHRAPRPLEHASAVACRRLGTHRLGRRDAHRAPDRRLGAERGDDQAADERRHRDVGRQPIVEHGKAEELVVHADHRRAEPRARPMPASAPAAAITSAHLM